MVARRCRRLCGHQQGHQDYQSAENNHPLLLHKLDAAGSHRFSSLNACKIEINTMV
jgi:hypothetical protein